MVDILIFLVPNEHSILLINKFLYLKKRCIKYLNTGYFCGQKEIMFSLMKVGF